MSSTGPLKVVCPNCGAKLLVRRPLQRDTVARCKRCKTKLVLGQVSDGPADEGPAEFAVRAAGESRKQASGSEPPLSRRAVDWAVGAVVATICVSAAVYFLTKDGSETPPTDRAATADDGGSSDAPAEAAPVSPSDGGVQTAGGAEPKPEPEPVKETETPSATDSDENLAARVEGILRANCHRCHGEGGSNEGGFNFVLSRRKLVADSTYVATGNPEDSLLYERIAQGEMPPRGESPRPDNADVVTIRQWIEAGAPDFSPPIVRDFVDNDAIFRTIAEDLRAHSNERDLPYFRYFTLTHLYNAQLSDEELETYRLALGKLLNSLSWQREIIQPSPIDSPINTIYRIDLRDLDWTDSVWTKIIDADPYALVHSSPFAPQCRDATGCDTPVVRADWFVAAASKAPLYHDVLQLPATVQELAERLVVDLQRRIEEERVSRAGFARSGVSQNNRLIERHDSPYGALWISYDFAGNTGRRNLFTHPLGPGKGEHTFRHDGGEIIFNLPNGLQGYMLVDADGKRLDKGPTEIVTDDKRPDRTVVNGISCMSCHYMGVITKADEIRPHVTANNDVFPEADRILALYPPREDMTRLQESDAQRFQQAVERAGITKITESGEPVVNMAQRFESNLDHALVSAELGLRPEEFTERLNLPQNRTLARQLGAIQVEGGTIKREVFVDVFPVAAVAFGMGTPVSESGKSAAADQLAGQPHDASESESDGESTAAAGEPEDFESDAADASAGVRKWLNEDGSLLAEAELIDFDGADSVTLRGRDGKDITLSITELSQSDQQVVRETAFPADLPQDEGPVVSTKRIRRRASGRGRTAASDPAKNPNLRTWTPIDGMREPFIAEFWGIDKRDAGTVLLKMSNGIVVRGPLNMLSTEDRNYVDSLLSKNRGREEAP